MRLTSDFWVSALMRRVEGEGAFAALIRRGAMEAGSVFIQSRNRFGSYALYGPAPQTAYSEEAKDTRLFVYLREACNEQDCREVMEREIRFDPDLWLVEIEDADTPERLFEVVAQL